MRSLSSRTVTYSLIILFGLLSALPNILPEQVLQKLPDWYASNQLTLGLDLRGGSHLLLAVDKAHLQLNTNQALSDRLVDELRLAKIHHGKSAVSTDDIRLSVNDPKQLADAARIARLLVREQGSTSPLYQIQE